MRHKVGECLGGGQHNRALASAYSLVAGLAVWRAVEDGVVSSVPRAEVVWDDTLEPSLKK